MMSIFDNYNICVEESKDMYDIMKSDSRLSKYVFKPTSGHFFRIRFPEILKENPLGINAISCSVPPDCNKNLKYGITYETALISDDQIVYNNDLGYDDIRRFSTVEEMIKEVLRVTEEVEKSFL